VALSLTASSSLTLGSFAGGAGGGGGAALSFASLAALPSLTGGGGGGAAASLPALLSLSTLTGGGGGAAIADALALAEAEVEGAAEAMDAEASARRWGTTTGAARTYERKNVSDFIHKLTQDEERNVPIPSPRVRGR
jgi:hypothetical protein